jgi:general secretion pathway protein F
MAAYSYIALDSAGKKQKGVLQADSAKSVRGQLRDRGLTPMTVEIVSQQSTSRSKGFSLFQRKISVAELALLTRQFATMLAAGIPLEETLLSVAEQSEKGRIKNIVMAVRAKVLEGHSFAEGLGEFPAVFDKLYCATVAAGEKTGHLDRVLERLADFGERRQKIRQKIQQALIYPSIIVLASVAIVSFLLIYVVPKMVTVFQQSGQILPTATLILLAISSFLQHAGLYVLAGLVIFIIVWTRLLKRPHFRAWVDAWTLRLPLFGKSVRLVNTARFAHTFAILNTAGVEVIEAMRVSTELVANTSINKALEVATKQVREGVNISRALKQTGYFPPMSIYLIASGENSGKLDAMLERTASNQETQVEQTINIILTLFEPLMILVMGSIVLFIVLAILLPIFNMDQFVH